MKKILFLLPILFFTCCVPLKEIPKEEFRKEEKIDNLNQSKEKLFVKANTWMSDIFENPESVIDFSDKEEGVIVGKYLMIGSVSYSGYGGKMDTRIFYKIDIRVKDNAAKILMEPVSNLLIRSEDFKKLLEEKTSILIMDFKEKISNTDDDW